MNYHHLSQEERYQIYGYLAAKKSLSEIADRLNRSKSTISREIKRNKGARGYRPKQAHILSLQRMSCNAKQIPNIIWAKVREKLMLYHSPEQIAGQLDISHESIYGYLYADKARGGTLYRYLRCQKKKRKRYGSGQDRRGQIINRRSIRERPAHVEKREKIGHWEGDTIIGAKHKQAIVTIVERKSGYTLLKKVDRKQADLVKVALIQLLTPYASLVDTITYDNGKEFAEHKEVDDILNFTTYFADPFSSWQRGTNENTNGLIRQFIPKKRLLATVSEEEITTIQHLLNTRPRKRLGYKTPEQVFMTEFNRVALHA
jgi:IS30 family transposase